MNPTKVTPRELFADFTDDELKDVFHATGYAITNAPKGHPVVFAARVINGEAAQELTRRNTDPTEADKKMDRDILAGKRTPAIKAMIRRSVKLCEKAIKTLDQKAASAVLKEKPAQDAEHGLDSLEALLRDAQKAATPKKLKGEGSRRDLMGLDDDADDADDAV